ncbi:NmrA-like family protein [Trichodelitschia bisporula]|uniref:NmrA-like family protein n=1 Tax=Trichodelitschia bisporula TaxID=703511 RepID=A0A6G1HIR6_9PEZI|nr:NmrA-like family protein [Trichodelitschia bisporula]
MTLKYLITGATGGLGAGVLSYLAANNPASDFAAASSRESNRAAFEARGIAFRFADYDRPETLRAAFAGVENLFFVSSNTFDNERRTRQHQAVVDAAVEAGVGHVWYTSLAFGGFGSDSKVDVQVAHLATEDMLRRSGIKFTTVREGVYAEAWPLFLNWYPESESVVLPADGPVAWTSREELGEANARLMMRGGFENQVVLLTAGETITFAKVVEIINAVTGRGVKFEIVDAEEYVRRNGTGDQGGKPAAFFGKMVSWFEGIAAGDAGTTDPLMKEVLGREPKAGSEAIRELLVGSRGEYIWHQNHFNQ